MYDVLAIEARERDVLWVEGVTVAELDHLEDPLLPAGLMVGTGQVVLRIVLSESG